MTKTIYFIRNTLIFLNQKKEIKIPYINSKKFLETNINEKYEEHKKNLNHLLLIKDIQISNPIENYNEIKKIINSKNLNIKPITKELIYDFEEITLSVEILTQFTQINSEEIFEQIYEKNKKIYLYQNQINKKELEIYLKKLKKINPEIEELNKKKEEFKEETLNKLKNNLKEIENKENKLTKEIKNLEENKNNEIITKLIEEIETLKLKDEELEFEKNKNKNKISLIKIQIKRITHEIRIGKKKYFRPFLFILTLGLIYWTKFSTNEYRKNKLLLEIDLLNEKNLIYDNNIIENKHQVKKIENQIKKIHLQNHIDESKIENELEKNKLNLEKNKKEKKKIIEELQKEENKLKKYETELETLKKEIEEINLKIKELEVDKLEELNKITKIQEKKYKEEIKILLEIKQKLETQSIENIQEEGFIEIEIK